MQHSLPVVATSPRWWSGGYRFILLNLLVTSIAVLSIYLAPQQALAVTSLFCLLILSLWRLELALAFQVSGFILVGFSWGSLGFAGYTLALLFAIIGCGYGVHLYRFGARLKKGFIPTAVALVFALMLVGFLYTPAPGPALEKIAMYVILNVALFGIVILGKDLKLLLRLLWAIAGFGLVLAVASYIDILFFRDALTSRYAFGADNPIWFSRSMGLTAILLLSLSRNVRNQGYHLFKWVIVVCLLYLMIVSGSRGPMLSLIVTVVIFLLWSNRRRSVVRQATYIGVFIAAVLLLQSMLPETVITGRLTTVGQGGPDISLIQRIREWQLAVELFRQHPLTGVGTAGFLHHQFRYPHNIFLEFAAEHGIAGLALLLGMLAAVVRYCWRLRVALRGNERAMIIYRSFTLILIYAFLNAQVSGSITGNSWLWLGMGGIWALVSYLHYYAPPSPQQTSSSGTT
ncbi:MAG: O-antigen ligase family protein [candidate division Zixibacteria bacterium]|nr:O-antigen ligase family protein [candidate division Zixibacteria bacterium]